jgi:hypothetical protein
MIQSEDNSIVLNHLLNVLLSIGQVKFMLKLTVKTSRLRQSFKAIAVSQIINNAMNKLELPDQY